MFYNFYFLFLFITKFFEIFIFFKIIVVLISVNQLGENMLVNLIRTSKYFLVCFWWRVV